MWLHFDANASGVVVFIFLRKFDPGFLGAFEYVLLSGL